MVIRSDRGYVGGKPRIEGHTLWISHIVANIEDMGLEGYINDFELEDDPKIRNKIREALEYCMNERCIEHALHFCQGCNKNKIEDEFLWETAKRLYERYFG